MRWAKASPAGSTSIWAGSDDGRARQIVGWSPAACVSILALVLYGIPFAARRLAPLVPLSVEQRLGDATDTRLRAMLGGRVCARPDGAAALARMVGARPMISPPPPSPPWGARPPPSADCWCASPAATAGGQSSTAIRSAPNGSTGWRRRPTPRRRCHRDRSFWTMPAGRPFAGSAPMPIPALILALMAPMARSGGRTSRTGPEAAAAGLPQPAGDRFWLQPPNSINPE